jgi:hypothetical protein
MTASSGEPDPEVPRRHFSHYSVRHLERFPIGTKCSEMATHVTGLFAKPTLAGSSLIVPARAGRGPTASNAVDSDAIEDRCQRLVGIAVGAGSKARLPP